MNEGQSSLANYLIPLASAVSWFVRVFIVPVRFASKVEFGFHKLVRLYSFSLAKVLQHFIQVLSLCQVGFSLYRKLAWQRLRFVVTFWLLLKVLLWVKSGQDEFAARYQTKRLAFRECA
jgi:hypothetical protein